MLHHKALPVHLIPRRHMESIGRSDDSPRRQATQCRAPLVRRSVSFSEAQPVTHRYPAKRFKPSFSPSGPTMALVSLVALFFMLVVYSFFALVGVNGDFALRAEAAILATNSSSGGAGVIDVAAQQLVLPTNVLHRKRGAGVIAASLGASSPLLGAAKPEEVEEELEEVDIDFAVEGEEAAPEPKVSLVGGGGGTVSHGSKLQGLLLAAAGGGRGGFIDSVREPELFAESENEPSLGLGMNGHDGVMLPGVAEDVAAIEEMAEEIEKEANVMKKSIQMLLRRADAPNKVLLKVEEGVDVLEDPDSLTAAISISGLRKHLRGEVVTDARQQAKKTRNSSGRVRGGAVLVPVAAGRVEQIFVEPVSMGDRLVEAAEEAILRGSDLVGEAAVGSVGGGNMLKGTNSRVDFADVIEQVKDGGKIGAKAFRGIGRAAQEGVFEKVTSGSVAVTDIASQISTPNLRGTGGGGVVDAVVGVMEDLQDQDDNLTAHVMAGVGDVVAASANKLRVRGGQEEDVAVMDGVVDVIKEEVKRIGGGRLRGAVTGQRTAESSVKLGDAIGSGLGDAGRSDGQAVAPVEEANIGRLRRNVEKRMKVDNQQVQQLPLRAASEARKANRENRLRVAS
eukprot:GHVS01015068.1.p1 GENE.GHVS01015068.1~~GHVS01015068.1.p1  ORF type:complete len:621 (+),score=141.51 GHVS01015068.1:290-2152(+)